MSGNYGVYDGRTLVETFENADTVTWFLNSNFFMVRYDGCLITVTHQKEVIHSFVPKS